MADVDDEFVAQAWRSARQRAWQVPSEATRRRAELNDALKIVAETRESTKLLKVWEDEKGSGMSPEMAYSTLDVPRDVDETMLLTVYSMRVCSNYFCLCTWLTQRACQGRGLTKPGRADA